MESFLYSNRSLACAGADAPRTGDTPAWLQQIREPLLHSHGLRWPQLVLPNNYFFFARNAVKQMSAQRLSHVLHGRHELVVCYRGRAKVCLDEAVYDFAPGMAKLVRPGQFHSYFDFEDDSIAWLLFSFDLMPGSSLMNGSNAVSRLGQAQLDCIADAASRYIAGVRTGEGIYAIARDMAEVILSLQQAEPVAAIGRTTDEAYRSSEYLRRIAAYVDVRMEEAIRIDDLARELDMSEGHLRKLFRELTGVSLGNWLRQSRFGRGVRLIAESDLSISEIARLSGFETIHSFSQAFSKKVGMSPTAYRKWLGENDFSAGENIPMVLSWSDEAAIPPPGRKRKPKPSE